MANHYYTKTGEPMHWVPKKDGKGNRPTTIADARKLGLLPSVTTVLETLDKPELTNWKVRQAVTAVLTAPRVPGEELDAFVQRVLYTDREQDQEAKVARDRGTAIHDALEAFFNNRPWDPTLAAWVERAAAKVMTLTESVRVIETEHVLVGNGYAGRADLIVAPNDQGDEEIIVDFKTAKTLPRPDRDGVVTSWPEHRMQLGAYARARNMECMRAGRYPNIRVANVYISTVDLSQPPLFVEDKAWDEAACAFERVLEVWCWLRGYNSMD